MTRELSWQQVGGLGLQLFLTVVTEPMQLALGPTEPTPVTVEQISPAQEARDYCAVGRELTRETVVREDVNAPTRPTAPSDKGLETLEHSPDIAEELPELEGNADPTAPTELVVDPPDALAQLREEILARQAASLSVERHLSEQIRERRANELPEGPEREEFRKTSLASQADREENIRKEYSAELQALDSARNAVATLTITPPTVPPKEL